MGANPTQAKALVLFLIAFTLIAAGLAADISIIALLAGFVILAASVGVFLKCKPWEYRED
jgi:hypothetical protein